MAFTRFQPPGSYDLVLEAAGFKKVNRGPIVLESSRTLPLDFHMEAGNTATEVTVKDDAPLVQQATSTIQYGVDLKQIDEVNCF